jgi:penicillin-binding protein-related factor A (putative recombinase)
MAGKHFNTFIADQVPADIAACHNGRSILIECKQTKQKSFPIENIKPHQTASLMKHQKAGGVSLFTINFNNRERTKLEKVNRCFAIDAINVDKYIRESTTSSIPMDYFIALGDELERYKRDDGKFCWNVSRSVLTRTGL